MDFLNGTIDPRCLAQPPLSSDVINELDMFGIALYFILTLMAVVSLLIHLEECLYIYKKHPYPKKTNIIWVNGAAPIMATMACLGMWVPKATMFTDMTSNSYFAVVIYKFLILMFEECGGDEAFLRYSANTTYTISTGPCCCCCPCLPRMRLTRRKLFLLKLGSLQYAVLRTVFSIFNIVLWTNGIYSPTNLGVKGVALWINLFVGVLTIIALWPVGIIFMNVRTKLRSVKMIEKYAMYQLVFVLSQLQAAIINILAINGVIACSGLFSSTARGSMLIQQLVVMEMFIITLVTRMLYRRTYDPVILDPLKNEDELEVKINLNSNSDQEHAA